MEKISLWGYNGVELWEPHVLRVKNKTRLATTLKSLNIVCSSIVSYIDVVAVENKDTTEIKHCEQVLSICQALDCNVLRVFAGNKPSNKVDLNLKDVIYKGLLSLSKKAKERNVRLLVETHHDTLTDSPYSAEMLFTNLYPEIGCILDLANLIEADKDWEKALYRLMPFTEHFHIKNTPFPEDLSKFNPFRHVFNRNLSLDLPSLEEGYIDYKKVFKVLKEYKFNKWLVLEWFGKNVQNVAVREILYMRNLLEAHSKKTPNKACT